MSYPDDLSIAVTLDGVDITDYLRVGTLQIESVLTHQVDTCKLRLLSSVPKTPEDWMEIAVQDGATKLFGGFVQVVRKEELGLGYEYTLECADYACLLDRIIVKAEYEDMTDAAILADLFADYLPEIDASTHVTAIKTHTKIRFNRMTLRECVNALADYADGDWYIDYDENLHFFLGESNSATFDLSDSPDYSQTYPFSDLELELDGTGVVNRVEVVGGNYLSDDQTIYLEGTGQDNRITMPFKMHEPAAGGGIQVYRNDGTESSPVWTQLTVKVGHIDSLSGADEALHYFQEQVLEQQNAWPNLPNAVKVIGRYEVPLRARIRDTESYAHYGRWFDDTIVDSDITDKNAARLAGKGKLAQSALAATAITCKTRQPGLRSGEVVHLTSSRFGIDADYLIQKVSMKETSKNLAEFAVSLGTYNPDLIDIMARLARQAKPRPLWREDEVLDELLEHAESLSLAESCSVAATSAPYTWGPGGANDFKWGFGVWS